MIPQYNCECGFSDDMINRRNYCPNCGRKIEKYPSSALKGKRVYYDGKLWKEKEQIEK